MKKALILIGGCLTALLLLFSVTDPNKLPSFVLIAPFVLIFIIVLVISLGVFARQAIPSRRNKVIAVLCAGVPVVLLIMQSIGQLTLRDVITICALFALAFFYISRTIPKA